jgi:hypothetical protein
MAAILTFGVRNDLRSNPYLDIPNISYQRYISNYGKCGNNFKRKITFFLEDGCPSCPDDGGSKHL